MDENFKSTYSDRFNASHWMLKFCDRKKLQTHGLRGLRMRGIMKISENTSVTVGVVLVIIGGIFWLSRIAFVSESNAQSIQEIQIKQDEIQIMRSDVVEIKNDIKWMKQRMDAK